ncbi:type 4 pilus major pilin [Vibrio hepatarius]|uniref:type 4 pilus major pilin n=1 Tax=Vibrio hepatarius TaxID=171383 RepID=UPI001C088F94|nr:type 4 pilus major pilin [Vibrio hepatarius]MBU2896059.1 prepilin-type N-terminal cleavage/methylation domain-containing protein [Vibrio hepatarius]
MRNNTINLKPKSKKGFTIIEITVALVVIAILSATLLPRFFEQQKASQAKSEFDKITELRQRIENLYDGDLNYDGVDVAWLDQVPKSFTKKGKNVYNVWKNTITVGKHGQNGYYIEYNKVPKGIACTEFAKLGRDAGWAEIKIDTASVLAETSTPNIAKYCRADNSTAVVSAFRFIHKT